MEKAKNYKIMIIYKKTDEWYIEWHRMTTSDNEWHRVVQRMTTIDATSGIASDNEWRREQQKMTMNDREWQRVIKRVNRNESK